MTATTTEAPEQVAPAGHRRRSIWSRLFRGETTFRFVGHWKRWFAFSAVVIIVGMAALGFRGLNFSIEFKGGTSWQVPTSSVTVAQARSALGSLGTNATIETLGSRATNSKTLQVQSQLSGTPAQQSAEKAKISGILARLANVKPSVVSVTSVGPTWGQSITNKAIKALIIFFICIGLYITFRFEWKMAVSALIAVFHDLVVTVGIYALIGFQVSPATVVAVLTILGYSLYDTIVVFDKVKENSRGIANTGRITYSDTVNLSMNQVLMRSVNTSIVAIIPILSILIIGAIILGATTLQDFGLALVIGLTSGAYSSIFIASPLLALLKEREPHWRSVRAKLVARGEGSLLLTPAAVAAMASGGGSSRPGTIRPRPRKGTPQPPARLTPRSRAAAGSASRPPAAAQDRAAAAEPTPTPAPAAEAALPAGRAAPPEPAPSEPAPTTPPAPTRRPPARGVAKPAPPRAPGEPLPLLRPGAKRRPPETQPAAPQPARASEEPPAQAPEPARTETPEQPQDRRSSPARPAAGAHSRPRKKGKRR